MLRHGKIAPKTPVVVRNKAPMCYTIILSVYANGDKMFDNHGVCKSFSDAYTFVSILLTDAKVLEKFMKPDIIEHLTKLKEKPINYDKYTFKITKAANLSKFKKNNYIGTYVGLYDETEEEGFQLKYIFSILIAICERRIYQDLDSLIDAFSKIGDNDFRNDIKNNKKIP